MKKANPQGQPHDVVVHKWADSKGHNHNQLLDTAAPSQTPEPPTHPALSFWDINRKLKKLEDSYRRDQETKPSAIESSSVGNPRVAAIFWRVKRLKQYVEEIEAVYETEINAGRFADTPDLWAAVYAQKILPSALAKIGSLMWNLAHKLWLTGEGGPGEQASVAAAQMELSQLRVRIKCELANAASQAENARSPSGATETLDDLPPYQSQATPEKVLGAKRKSNPIDDKKAAVIFLAIKTGRRGEEYCEFLRENGIRTSLNPWAKGNCPREYTEAYRVPRWKRLIHQEKSRFKTRMEELVETEFLSLAQALESFHRLTDKTTVADSAVFKSFLKLICHFIGETCGDSPLESRFLAAIRYANEPTFRSRIESLLARIKHESLSKLVGDHVTFEQTLRETRNYFTHPGIRKQKHVLTDGKGLFLFNQKLHVLLRLLIFKNLGFPEEVVFDQVFQQLHRWH
jgi:hypothetical protein